MVTLAPLAVRLGVLVTHRRIIVLLLASGELGNNRASLSRLEGGVVKRRVLCSRIAVSVGRNLDWLLRLVVFWVRLMLLESVLNRYALESCLALRLLALNLLVLGEVLEVLRVRVGIICLCFGSRVEFLCDVHVVGT